MESVGVNQSIGESHDVTRRSNTVILSRIVCTRSTSGYIFLDSRSAHDLFIDLRITSHTYSRTSTLLGF